MNYPKVSIIIIGLNVEKYIENCISSILNLDYPKDKIEIIYSDSGSKDNTLNIVKKFLEVKIVKLETKEPTPGKGRNAGAKEATGEYIQFLDADTEISTKWLKEALPYLKDNIQAIWGRRIEKFPDKNIYHKIGNFEWAIMGDGSSGFKDGICRSFGGDALVLKKAFFEINGYDEDLIAGEDPEISYRFRNAGYQIYRINSLMTTHDLNMNNFKQYWKRSFRTGHAYAEIGMKFILKKEKLFLREFIRIQLGVILPMTLFLSSFLFSFPFFLINLLLGFLIFFRPILKIISLKKKSGFPFTFLTIYCLHLSFVIIPQFIGSLRYLLTKIGFKALKNKI